MERDFNFEKLFDQAIYEYKSQDLGDRTQYVGASEIGCCPRMVYLKKLAEDKAKTTGSQARGHFTENAVVRMLKEDGTDIRWYGKRQKHLQVSALHTHVDGILYASKHPVATLEVKSIDPRGFYSEITIPRKWIGQVYAEMGLAHLRFDERITEGKLILVDASNYENRLAYRFQYSPEKFNALVEKAKWLVGCIAIGDEPKPDQDDFDCKYCPFKADCSAYQPPEDAEDVYEHIEDDELDKWAVGFVEAKNTVKTLQDKIKKRLNELKKKKVILPNSKINWYPTTKRIVDVDLLRRKAPDTYNAFLAFDESRFKKEQEASAYIIEKKGSARLDVKCLS